MSLIQCFLSLQVSYTKEIPRFFLSTKTNIWIVELHATQSVMTTVNHLERFFNSKETFGSIAVKGLLQDISYDNGGIPTKEKKFFYVLRGEKTAAKQHILSKCLLLCTLKWRKTGGNDHGKMYQPTTIVQYIK